MTKSGPDLIIAGGYVPEISLSTAADATAREGRPTAVAVTGQRITAVGGEELRSLAGPATRLIDARGGAILPGINDAHLHLCASAITEDAYVDLSAAHTWPEVRQSLERAEVGRDGWLRAVGWDDVRLGPPDGDLIFQTRREVPVVAYDRTGHQLLLNETATQLAGVDARIGPRTDGYVGTFADGRPNGHLTDGAMSLAASVVPELPRDVIRNAILRFQRRLHAWGITSLTEPGLGPGGASLFGGTCGDRSLSVLVELAARAELTLRVTVLALFDGTGGASLRQTLAGLGGRHLGLASAHGVDPLRLRVAGVKIFADGTPRSGTAWMTDEYVTPQGPGRGHLVVAGDDDAARSAELEQIVAAVHSAGLQAGVHVTGDASTAAAIDAIVAAQGSGETDLRHYVIHGAFRDDGELDRLARHGIGYSTNPAIRSQAGALIRGVVGPHRFDRHQPLASALAAGVRPTIASDSPVTSADWRHTVVAAVTRDTTAGPGGTDEERLSLSQALALMTSTAAWQDHAEHDKGGVVPGQLADLCVLAGPLPRAAQDLHDLRTAVTVVGGQVVHDVEATS